MQQNGLIITVATFEIVCIRLAQPCPQLLLPLVTMILLMMISVTIT
jgi:hypothetical protein